MDYTALQFTTERWKKKIQFLKSLKVHIMIERNKQDNAHDASYYI